MKRLQTLSGIITTGSIVMFDTDTSLYMELMSFIFSVVRRVNTPCFCCGFSPVVLLTLRYQHASESSSVKT